MSWRDDEIGDHELPDEADLRDADDPGADQVQCPACRAWMFEDADQCPHCGNWVVPSAEAATSRRWIWWVAAILAAAALVWVTVR